MTEMIHGAVHVTGGGVPGKLGRALFLSKLGARLDNLFPPSPGFFTLQKYGRVSDEECYRTWNMGQGLLILCEDTDTILKIAGDMGFEACVAGETTSNPEIRIRSHGVEKGGDFIVFPVKG